MDTWDISRSMWSLLSVCLVLHLLAGVADSGRIHLLSTKHKRVRRATTDTDGQRTSFSVQRMPESMALLIELNTTTSLNLSLKRNDHVTNMVPVTIGVRGRIRPWKCEDRQDFAAYIDPDNYAAMFVKSKGNEDHETGFEYLGSFKMGRDQFVVEPVGFPDQPSRRKRSADGATDYVIRAVKPHEYNYTYDSINRLEKQENYRREIIQYASQMLDDNPVPYVVECLIIIDYAIYKNWYDRAEGYTETERRDEAINLIRYYYTHIANGIDLRYMSINEPDFRIYVRLSGFHIATTPESSPWTEGASVREVDQETGRVYTHAYKGLDELESWLQMYQTDLPFFDQATLFSGNKLFGGLSSQGLRRHIVGLADIGGICTQLRASICQENGQYASTQTAAHEMGHNLGAYHDGTNNSCSKLDQYIMAPAPTELTEENFYNPYKFSPCSVQKIREQIRVMNVRNMNCLVNEAQHFNQTEFNIHMQTLPGQIISLDNQCKNLFGIHSYYCAGMINDQKVCLELICYDPFQALCWRGHEQRAAIGTSCGNKKWCEQGKCVYNENAPEIREYCMSGDFQGRLYNGITCRDVGYERPRLCYDDYFNKSCCATCEKIFNRADPTCAFGDKYDWCFYTNNRQVVNCYDASFKDSCCEFCKQQSSGISGCEFGDKASWCATDVPHKPDLCYNSDQLCCGTCPKYHTGNEGCEYGDKASWCTEYDHPSDCYNTDIADKCCNMCGQFMREYGLIDCPYGDRVKSCHKDMCADRSNWYRCCYTCKEETGNTRRLTTVTTESTTTERTTGTTTSLTTTTTRTTSTTSVTTTTADCVDSARWCKDIHASSCYTVDDICCQTCRKAYTGKEGCEYGDHFSWCAGKRDHCGDPAYDDCCVTCEGYITQIHTTTIPTPAPTLQASSPPVYGNCVDKASWCINSNSYCYTDKDTCCQTCSRAYIGITGCEYGDHYTWCQEPDINCEQEHVRRGCCVSCNNPASRKSPSVTEPTPPRHVTSANTECVDKWVEFCANAKSNDCYYDSYKFGCCATCAQYQTGVEGCEYGDKWSWCVTVDEIECQRQDIAEPCCRTCAKESISSSASPTVVAMTTSTTKTTTTTMMSTTEAWLGCTVDKAKWCPTITSAQCYGAEKDCCETCPKFYIGKGGCEYGDKATWCRHYVQKPSDCERPGVLENCCLSCDDFGYPIPEREHEHNEGVLLEFNSTINEVERKQMQLIASIARSVNKYCSQNIDLCCNVKRLFRNSTHGLVSLLRPEDVFVAAGYPQPSSSQQTVWDKLLVKIDSTIYKNLCSAEYNEHVRRRRGVDDVYMDKNLLYNILEDNKNIIERDIQLTILQVRQPKEEASSSSSGNITAVLSSCLTVCFIVLVVIGVCYMMKVKRIKVQRPAVFSLFHFGWPTAFNSKSFSSSNWIERRIHGNKHKHGTSGSSISAKLMDDFPWSTSLTSLNEAGKPSPYDAHGLNNLEGAFDGGFPCINNLHKCPENLIEELEVDNLKKNERVVTVYSGDESFVMAKENCTRDSRNMHQVTLKDLDGN